MRSALALSASSLIILVALLPEGELRWWLVVFGIACIWLLRLAAEEERRAEAIHRRNVILNDLDRLHRAAEARQVAQTDESEVW